MTTVNIDSLYRGEKWRLSYGVESAYGESPTSDGNNHITSSTPSMNLFGVFQDATLADPTFDHTPYWFQNSNNRNYTMAYKGKATCQGSIPNIVLLNGWPLALPISNTILHGFGVIVGNSGTIAAANSPLISSGNGYNNTVTISTIGTFSIYLPDGTTGTATTAGLTVDNSPVSLTTGLNSIAVSGAGTPKTITIRLTSAISGRYVHVINDSINLKSFRVAASYYDATSGMGTATLNRYFVGGKVNTATYSCEEGGMLQMSLNDIKFKMPYYLEDANDPEATIPHVRGGIAPWRDLDVIEQNAPIPSTEPFYFSYAALKMKLAANAMEESIIRSVRKFNIEVDNNLDPKYYLMTNDEKVPYQIYEGKRTYKLGMEIDLIDNLDSGNFDKNDFFRELLNQGKDTILTGAGMQLTFTKPSDSQNNGDYIMFNMPGQYTPVSGANTQGGLVVRAGHPIIMDNIVSVGVEMIMPSLTIVVCDGISGSAVDGTAYPY